MRVLFLLVFSLLVIPLGWTAALPEDRRVEEEKREDLKPTEAQYHDSSITEVKPEAISRDYFDQLFTKKTADYADAAYVIAVLINKTDVLKEQKEGFLLEHDLLPKKNKKRFSNQQPLSRGDFAYMLLKVLKIKGGLTLRAFGPNARYAHRELVYEDIMISGSTAEYMSGRELVHSFLQAANFIARQQSNDKPHE